MNEPQSTNGDDGHPTLVTSLARLQGWQTRLDDHFARLAMIRREADWPVFALEHGLSVDDRNSLLRDVRECADSGPQHDVPLPWVVYAAEVGYEYSGYEYWQTFETKTPGWQLQWRERIRSNFVSFATTYHGAEPAGNWARQFSIIAWPIAHGILPRDLQRQLAELLYEGSTSFSAETFSSAEALGLHLQARSSGYSSRFRNFAENATLLGQIALALLLQDTADAHGGSGGAILHTNTLERIVADLNRERDARQWLAEARSAAHSATRFHIRGLSRITLRRRLADTTPRRDRSQEGSDSFDAVPKPHFLLREEVQDRWQVRLQFPNLAHLAAQSPRSRDILMRRQGKIAGATTPILATSRIVLDAAPTVTLSTWPKPQTQLLAFDGAPPELNALLSASFRVAPGDRWLFAIGLDGKAREITTRVLRAGASYLLLQTTHFGNPPAGLGLSVVYVACAGVYALRIDVPKQVSDVLTDVLSNLELVVAQTIEVWPAGLPVSVWNGEGQLEGVTGQPIILGIGTDHRLTRLEVVIDDIPQPDIETGEMPPGGPIFLQLPLLSLGPHDISIAASTGEAGQESIDGKLGGQGATPGLRGKLSCIIREPRTIAAGQGGALSFAILPTSPSLEDVWEGRIEIHVAAPGIESIRGRVVLRGLEGQELFNRSISLPSPCNTDTWNDRFAEVRKAASSKYDDAQVCAFEFDAGALGRRQITAERDFTPLRWAVRDNGRRVILIDSQGCVDLNVSQILCATPLVEEQIDPSDALNGIVVPDGGALIVARSGRLGASTVVVPPQRVTSLDALSGARAEVLKPSRNSSAILALARKTALWERARLAGSWLAEARRGTVVGALISALIGTIAGERWMDAEELLRDEPPAAQELMHKRVAIRPDERAIAGILARRIESSLGGSVAQADQVFLDAIVPFVHEVHLDAIAPYALRLASSPSEARALVDKVTKGSNYDEHEKELIDDLLLHPVIIRAARYFIVATRALVSRQGREYDSMPWAG